MKINQHNAGHMTKMAATPYMIKHFKNLLSRNHWADFDETLYEASETSRFGHIHKTVGQI